MAESEEKSGVTRSPIDWEALLQAAAATPKAEAMTFHKGPWASASRPVCMKCEDGIFRVLKGQQAGGRMLFNDQVIARLAQRLGAPVPQPAIVSLSAQLVAAEPRLAHMRPGLCHGLAFLDDHSDRMGITGTDHPPNRDRFARLAVLYGWAHASDHQQIYPNHPPPLVWSVDHGHFVGPGDHNWTVDLIGNRGPAAIDQNLANGAALKLEELVPAVQTLAEVTAYDLAGAIACAPNDWGVAAAERVAFASYMWKRRQDILRVFPQVSDNASEQVTR